MRIQNSLVPGANIFIQQKDSFPYYNAPSINRNIATGRLASYFSSWVYRGEIFPVGFSPAFVSGKPQYGL